MKRDSGSLERCATGLTSRATWWHAACGRAALASIALWIILDASLSAFAQDTPKKSALEQTLAETHPLTFPVGTRAPLFFWTPDFPAGTDDAELERTLLALKARGIALLHRWGLDVEKSAAAALRIGRLQKKLEMPVAVDGTGIAHGFYNGDKELAFVDAAGNRFLDTSFFWQPGCAFSVHKRFAEKRKLFEAFVSKYQEAGVPLDYWMADWEFDGPNEWNDGWAAAKKCVITRAKIQNIDTDFAAFQKAVREIRTEMQREVFTKPILETFPKARVGNYAMSPHNGKRYWWDFYEKITPGLPYEKEQNALYRPWTREFEQSGYTLAMPVIYTWYSIYDSYAFENKQYRWFYNMLLEASSVGESTPQQVPWIPFVHWTTTNPPKSLPADFEAMSEANYEELLWHMLLRGCDGFCMWSPAEETAAEVRPVHRVYDAAGEYADFLDRGVPVLFDVPKQPGTVVSALKLENRLLVRRTDFGDSRAAVKITVDGRSVEVPHTGRKCLVLSF